MSFYRYHIYLLISLHLSFTASQAPTSRTIEGRWGPWRNVTDCEFTDFFPGQERERDCFVGGRVVNRLFCKGTYRLIVKCEPQQFGIVHGIRAELGDWPWQVFIELDGGKDQCGGSLIEDMWVLTAAHCLSGRKKATRVTMSSNNKYGLAENAINTIAERVVCHDDFESRTLTNDICLVKIPWVENRGFAAPVRYTLTPRVANGTECKVTGWGYNEDANLPDNLQEAGVKIIDKKQCEEWHGKHGTKIPAGTVCAGHAEGGADTCGGDSGGPLVCQIDRGPYFLYGVTSFGPVKCGARRLPGIYTSVKHFQDWIEKTIKSSFEGYHWGEWNTTCSVTCGKGQMTMVRKCLNKERDTVNPDSCDGKAFRVGECNLERCIVYSWTEWKGECSVTCGYGIVKSTRTCMDEKNQIVKPELCGGGETEQTAICFNARDCPEAEYNWTPWASARCSVTCGSGEIVRKRQCMLKNKVADPHLCIGENRMNRPCDEPPCKEIFTWGPWLTLPCSVSCGQGEIVRERHCLSKDTATEGDTCPGNFKEIQPCSKPECRDIYSWGPWIEFPCSVTCGKGKVSKIRHCINEKTEIIGDSCSGSNQAEDDCTKPPCSDDFSWGPWFPPSACSVTCGTGQTTRKRDCVSSKTLRRVSGCSGKAEEVLPCRLPDCKGTEYRWGEWRRVCSVTCGSGTEESTRACLDDKNRQVPDSRCNGRSRISGTCDRAACPKKYRWEQWKRVCSVTCGTGSQQNNRRCLDENDRPVGTNLCSGRSQFTNTCSLSPCRKEYHWSEWRKSCSVTCGPGIQENTRTCLDENDRPVSSNFCNGRSQFSDICNLSPCRKEYHWSEWRKTCSVTCGSGIQENTRTCLDENDRSVGSNFCDGRSQFLDICKLSPCRKEYHWGEWKTVCSVTCGTGLEKNTRTCLDENDRAVRSNLCDGRSQLSGTCTLTPCQKEYHWSEWRRVCSVTCGTGTQQNTRLCLDENDRPVTANLCIGRDQLSTACSRAPCGRQVLRYKWSEWQGACSVTCERGVEYKSRDCLNEKNIPVDVSLCNGRSHAEEACIRPACPTDFSWGEWIGVCSVTCGFGTEIRRRECLDGRKNVVDQDNCAGNAFSTSTCNLGPCSVGRNEYKWGPWERTCSVTCGTGVENIRRSCLDRNNNQVSESRCQGLATQRGECRLDPCRGINDYHWGEWKNHCSVTCGRGTEHNIRDCLDRNDRPVSTSLCEGRSHFSDSCIRSSCPAALVYKWGEWSVSCSVTCGVGQEVKFRVCLDANSKGVDSKNCGPGPVIQQGECFRTSCKTQLGNWGPWSSYSECSVTCGRGLRKRTRECRSGFCGAGDSSLTTQCDMDPCGSGALNGWGNWNGWSRCRLKRTANDRCTGFQSTTRSCFNRGQDAPPRLCGNDSDNYKERECRVSLC